MDKNVVDRQEINDIPSYANGAIKEIEVTFVLSFVLLSIFYQGFSFF